MVWALDKAKQYGWFALKLLTLIIAVWLILHTLSPIPTNSWRALSFKLWATSPSILALLILLSLLNWSLEILKWQTAIRPFRVISLSRAARETLLAFSIGFITPIKLGEYAVKIQFYPDLQKKNIIITHFFCHFSQLLCTLIFGIIGLLNFDSAAVLFRYKASWIILMAALMLTTILLYKRFKKTVKKEPHLPGHTLIKIFVFSALRFIVFSFMLVLSLHIMGNTLVWTQIIFGIWTMYLFQVIAPTFSALDIAIKSGGALLIFQGIIPAQIIMGAIVLQYCLSQIFPLIIGLTLNTKTLKTQ